MNRHLYKSIMSKIKKALNEDVLLMAADGDDDLIDINIIINGMKYKYQEVNLVNAKYIDDYGTSTTSVNVLTDVIRYNPDYMLQILDEYGDIAVEAVILYCVFCLIYSSKINRGSLEVFTNNKITNILINKYPQLKSVINSIR